MPDFKVSRLWIIIDLCQFPTLPPLKMSLYSLNIHIEFQEILAEKLQLNVGKKMPVL